MTGDFKCFELVFAKVRGRWESHSAMAVFYIIKRALLTAVNHGIVEKVESLNSIEFD